MSGRSEDKSQESQPSEKETGITNHSARNPEFKSYRDLEVWQKAMDLVVECYRITKKFPKSETFGLASQLQRAGVSIPANIAEGRARKHTKEFLRHLSIAYSSLAELETHIQIAERLNYLDSDHSKAVMNRMSIVGRMINGLRKSLYKKT